jgi:signal transduction histidine kinase
LTVIKGNLDLLKRDISVEDSQESLKAIESETTRMTKITADLILLAEVESGQNLKLETVTLKSIIGEEIQRANILAGNRRIVSGRLEDLTVSGDIFKLKQVFSNLVENAIKYTTDGGTITIEVIQEGDWARVDISDTGIGIAPENLKHIFDRFYRVDKARSRAAGGSGLGLAIVKGIIEQHGGKISVASQPGKESVFTVWLKLKSLT